MYLLLLLFSSSIYRYVYYYYFPLLYIDMCWEKCIEKVPNRMDSKTEQCLVSCVERFMDTSNFVVNKLSTMKQ